LSLSEFETIQLHVFYTEHTRIVPHHRRNQGRMFSLFLMNVKLHVVMRVIRVNLSMVE